MRESFDLNEASIADVLTAYETGETTPTALTREYLARIDTYDAGPEGLHAIVVPNPEALAQAAESDARWAAGRPRALEGVPFTVKDSYMVRGLTVASGSPAFEHLVAQWDAFSVAKLREAGAVLLGKTNMPPMADGGMQRGVYGRAESPYNRDYLAAAYASGSSNGSAVATAANLAVFGMGEETVSSGRSPASNNGLCAYTPSWGVLSIRGNWPLFPARDVVVPHTRSMPDMLRLLDVLVQDDPIARGDFWRAQQVVPVPKPSDHRPESYLALAGAAGGAGGAGAGAAGAGAGAAAAAGAASARPLAGKRFAVPKMYLGLDPDFPIAVRPSVLDLWRAAEARLVALGAEIVVTDFPLIEQYEGDRPGQENVGALGVLPDGWMDTEFNHFLAYGWDDFLRANGDPATPTLADVDPDTIFPRPEGTLPDRYEEVEDYDNRYRAVVAFAQAGIPDPRERPDFAAGLRALVELRESLFEAWLEREGFDGVVFPANADVGREDAERDAAAADHAWANGVFFSNGNYALRHLGIPTVTVGMGVMSDIGMPVGLTFAGRAYADPELLAFAAAFEAGAGAGTLRVAPALP